MICPIMKDPSTFSPISPATMEEKNQMERQLQDEEEIKEENSNNRTPRRKKPKRKKYMPKVLREVKPRKPKTPASTVEKATGRRKYVRTKKTRTQPARRSLHFEDDAQEQSDSGDNHGLGWNFPFLPANCKKNWTRITKRRAHNVVWGSSVMPVNYTRKRRKIPKDVCTSRWKDIYVSGEFVHERSGDSWTVRAQSSISSTLVVDCDRVSTPIQPHDWSNQNNDIHEPEDSECMPVFSGEDKSNNIPVHTSTSFEPIVNCHEVSTIAKPFNQSNIDLNKLPTPAKVSDCGNKEADENYEEEKPNSCISTVDNLNSIDILAACEKVSIPEFDNVDLCSQSSTTEKEPICKKNQQNLSHGPQSRMNMLMRARESRDLGVIIKGLRKLNIKSGRAKKVRPQNAAKNIQPQNAIVLHDGGGRMIVPVPKKQQPKPRGKVDLDPESIRKYELLMAGQSTEEDMSLYGRVYSFIKNMELVLGIKEFFPWKGSVMDSVIGVILTQNVTDHLSSNAFMNLAATFPLRSKGNDETADTERINRPITAQLQVESTQHAVESHALFQNYSAQTCLSSQNVTGKDNLISDEAESKLMNEACTSQKFLDENFNDALKGKKGKPTIEKETYDWDNLRKEGLKNGANKERNTYFTDTLDYEAMRHSDVSTVAYAIRERGQNNQLAKRIKDLLDRLVKDHGSMDLEWLRNVPPQKAKDYLLSIAGLGIKSVECVRLLSLYHQAFPVDTNVGRICVRLGWVPLQPLPESIQLHLLEMYPVQEHIQKYLWPRLCKLDHKTLYRLHCLLIATGKVFCTKSKPNCNACPMRGECKHFASAFASTRLALPGPKDTSLVSSATPITSNIQHGSISNPMPIPQLEGSMLSKYQTVPRTCEPIIEEPASPEPELMKDIESDVQDAFLNRDIEDLFLDDTEEISTINLNSEEFTQNVQNYLHGRNMGYAEGDISKALVCITQEAASIPIPKLKDVHRLRTLHQVYVLDDSSPLLEGLDRRDPDDRIPYLLDTWTPGETSQSNEPPKDCCNSEDGKLCDNITCLGCNTKREEQARMVRGTILIPCRTANRGSFPLNGTYFQGHEVFADHYTSLNPLTIPREWIWSLNRSTLYCGSSLTHITRGFTTEEVQHFYKSGYICVRAFDRQTRTPELITPRFHLAPVMAAKMMKEQKEQKEGMGRKSTPRGKKAK